MKYHLIILLIFFPFSLFSQQKGVSPLEGSKGSETGQTYAVVVGISDYQDEGIPDLRFADRDAEAFANFLRSPAGGSLDGDHLKLLTNEQATAGQVGAELFWLLDESKEGDRAIIYFSGHGDVERKTLSQPGYLLCWNAPPRVYMAGGVVALPMFQDIISTLSVQNGAKVLVITDACRSGKLAGSEVGGAKITGANLAQQYANEVKVLSCQPDEYSIEGEQWGGGRGAFSYHLMDALYGMADRNSDLGVSLSEVGRYLEDHVTPEVAPHNQLPMTVGNGRETLTSVFPELLEHVREGKKGQLAMFTPTDSRSMEDDILATVDTTVRKMYRLFKRSLKDKEFLEPAGECADAYYTRLMEEPKLERLHASMTRNYAAALQDDAQEVMNKWLSTDSKELIASKANLSAKYQLYPHYLGRATELLGPEHYMYPILKARKYYFEGYLMHIDSRHADRELGENIMAKYREALRWQPNSAHIYYSMMVVSFYQLLEADSAEYYAHKATELAPAWIMPYSYMGWLYNEWTILRNHDKVRHFLELADKVDPTASSSNYWHMNNWGSYYKDTGQYAEAEQQVKQMIQLDPTLTWAYGNMAILYSQTGRYAEAEEYHKKSWALDSTDWITPTNLGILYSQTGRYAEAEVQFKKAHQLDSTNLWPPLQLACIYIETKRFGEAEVQFNQVIQLDPMAIWAYRNFGLANMGAKRYERAEELFKKVVQLNSYYVAAYSDLGFLYTKTRRFEEAEQQFLKAISLDSLNAYAYPSLGLVYAKMGRYATAEKLFEKGLNLNPANAKYNSVNYTVLYTLQGLTDKAFDALEQAFQQGYKIDDTHINLREDPDLTPLRDQKERWQALMDKYFPDQIKD